MKPREYYSLIYKSLNNEISDAEQSVLAVWLEADSAHRKIYDEVRLVWDLGQFEEDFEVLDRSRMQRQMVRLELNLSKAKHQEQERYRNAIVYRNVAIIILLIITFTVLISQFARHRETNTIAMSVNENKDLILPDSSMVSLNKDATLTFRQSLNNRNVIFQGEGYFQVSEDQDRPFIIQLPDGFIKVLGTSFFVKANAGDTTEVWVSSGIVEVSHNNKSVLLRKGETTRFTSNSYEIAKATNQNPNYNSWYTRKLQFEKTSLKKIISLLQDQYHIKFKVQNKDLMTCRFTGTFDDEALDTILQVLSQSMGFSFKLQDGVYFIEGKGCSN